MASFFLSKRETPVITDYDSGEGIITPGMCFTPSSVKTDSNIIVFSHEIHSHILSSFECREIGGMTNVNGRTPVYAFHYNGKTIGFYLSYLSSACSSFMMEESRVITGCDRYIVFGSCGTLDKSLTEGRVIVPTAAYRDEGMSYHYLEPSDYVDMKNHSAVSSFLERNKIPYIEGKTWTTDSFYRETPLKIEKRKKEGCISVEMEMAGLEAVSRFYGISLYAFLVPGDVVAPDEWRERENLAAANHSLDKFYVALHLADDIC